MREYLVEHGFECSIESRGDTAVSRIITEQPDCVVLDVMLPGMDGFDVCRAIRSAYRNPVLMMTARGDDVDEIVGLEIGADDYLSKPVQPRRLLTRIRALLRRSQWADTTKRDQFGALEILRGKRTVLLSGVELDLTTAEYDLLSLLSKCPGEPLTRSELHVQLRGVPYDGLDRSIDITVNRLRKKLGDDARRPQFIKSVRGLGYMLAVQQEIAP